MRNFYKVGDKVITDKYGIGYIEEIYPDEPFPLYRVKIKENEKEYILNEDSFMKYKEYGKDFNIIPGGV